MPTRRLAVSLAALPVAGDSRLDPWRKRCAAVAAAAGSASCDGPR